MPLIKSISGTRGTVGGRKGKNLTPIDIVESTAAYGELLKSNGLKRKVVLGRDGRISGAMVSQLVANTLMMQGFDVVDLGLSTTPTVEIAVPLENAAGGIIITASHNPKEWNALKFLNEKGEFISQNEGQQILDFQCENSLEFAEVDHLGRYSENKEYMAIHVQQILDLPIIDADLIASRKFRVVVDCINSTGALAIPVLLDALGVRYELLNAEISGDFAHNPEPLPKHMKGLAEAVKIEGANLGIAVDPDVDRLAFVCEDGSIFGEEYTLVAVADFVLDMTPGATVSNLSSTRALADVTKAKNQIYTASAVGEVNVVTKMKETNAVIGGEGNGGVIYPALHYGRDALVGIALLLNSLAEKQISLSALRKSYPDYTIVKNKIQLTADTNIEAMLEKLRVAFREESLNEIDGLKIDFSNGWVHLRKSNTEPIIRVYAEAKNSENANALIDKVMLALN